MSVNTLKIQSFLICKILIKLRMISIILLHSYKESNKKTAFLKGGGILDLFYLYCKIPDILRQWRNFGSILFVLFLELFLFTKYKYLSFFLCMFTCTQKLPQRSHTFLKRIYFICTANYTI